MRALQAAIASNEVFHARKRCPINTVARIVRISYDIFSYVIITQYCPAVQGYHVFNPRILPLASWYMPFDAGEIPF